MDDGRSADDFAALVDPFELPRIAVTTMLTPAVETRRRNQLDTGSRSLVGTLVHRLFERFGASLAAHEGDDTVASELRRLIQDDEIVEADDLEQLFRDAGEAYLALCGQEMLTRALESGDALFEVPFSVRAGSSQAILRGTFDCLIRRRDGGVTLLELKTGKPVHEHERQLDIYITAAKAMFPGTPVEGKLVYARHANLDDRALDAQR